MAGRVKKHDPMAGQMAKMVVNRPWLGWRHRRPMEAYTAARTRNSLVMGCMNGFFAVFNAATGKILFAPVIGYFSYQSLRNARRMANDPTPYQAEWQELRDALADAERRHSIGETRRRPSPL